MYEHLYFIGHYCFERVGFKDITPAWSSTQSFDETGAGIIPD